MSYKDCCEEVRSFAELHEDCLLCGSKLKYDVRHVCYGHGDFAFEMKVECPNCGVSANGALHYIDGLSPLDIYGRYSSFCERIEKAFRERGKK